MDRREQASIMRMKIVPVKWTFFEEATFELDCLKLTA
jgi:hypothetical protein